MVRLPRSLSAHARSNEADWTLEWLQVWRAKRRGHENETAFGTSQIRATGHFTEPAVRPLTMYRSRKMPIRTRGAMAAVASAAMLHQLMPCEPVWLATITGSVLASVLVSRAAKKYSFQHRTKERMNAATIPGSAIGSTIRTNALQVLQPSTRAACSRSVGIVSN